MTEENVWPKLEIHIPAQKIRGFEFEKHQNEIFYSMQQQNAYPCIMLRCSSL
jgi:hypothetical protein